MSLTPALVDNVAIHLIAAKYARPSCHSSLPAKRAVSAYTELCPTNSEHVKPRQIYIARDATRVRVTPLRAGHVCWRDDR